MATKYESNWKLWSWGEIMDAIALSGRLRNPTIKDLKAHEFIRRRANSEWGLSGEMYERPESFFRALYDERGTYDKGRQNVRSDFENRIREIDRGLDRYRANVANGEITSTTVLASKRQDDGSVIRTVKEVKVTSVEEKERRAEAEKEVALMDYLESLNKLEKNYRKCVKRMARGLSYSNNSTDGMAFFGKVILGLAALVGIPKALEAVAGVSVPTPLWLNLSAAALFVWFYSGMKFSFKRKTLQMLGSLEKIAREVYGGKTDGGKA
jgi:hypothetical protein